MTVYAILKCQSPPNTPPGPKECKHYVLFDLKVLILYFQQMLIYICTAPF